MSETDPIRGAGHSGPPRSATSGVQGAPRVNVDDLRARLRTLGYLDARVDRFVLGSAREDRPPWRVALGASARIGVLAAILLGPAAAAGLRARLPALITNASDAILAALYLGTLFGVAATGGAFLVVTVSGLQGRRRAADPAFAGRTIRTARIAGTLVTIACLAYLTLWWRAAGLGEGLRLEATRSLLGDVFALAVAVAVSVLLGHATTATILAGVARYAASAELAPYRRRRSWTMRTGAVIAAFGGAAALLWMTAPGAAESISPVPSLPVAPTGLRIVVIAIDGVETELLSLDTTPTVGALLNGPHLRVQPPRDFDPVRVWTSVATGVPPERHGLDSVEQRRVAGFAGSVPAVSSRIGALVATTTDVLRLTRPGAATGHGRRVKTFWEVAAERGFRTVVINWWATWPAPVDGGVLFSDRAVLRLDRGGPLDAEVAPPPAYDAVRQSWPELRARVTDRVEAAFGTVRPDLVAPIARAAEIDGLQIELATHPVTAGADLLVVYLPGLDIARHALMSAMTEHGAAELAPRLDALRQYYRYLDSVVHDVARLAPSDGAVVWLMHPGRAQSKSHGVFALTSKTRASLRGDARLTDVAPTILYGLGLPISRELEGRPQSGLFGDEFARRFPVQEVATYGPRRGHTGVRSSDALDEEAVERLRSLGYIR
jgi:hypothetical protein